MIQWYQKQYLFLSLSPFLSLSRGPWPNSSSPRSRVNVSLDHQADRSNAKFRFMFDHVISLEDAVEGYDLFDKMKVQKVIFRP